MSRKRTITDRQLSALLRRSVGPLHQLAEHYLSLVPEVDVDLRRVFRSDARTVTKLADIAVTGDLKRMRTAVLLLDTIVRDGLPNIVLGVAHYHVNTRWREGRCYCPDCVRWTDQPDLYQKD